MEIISSNDNLPIIYCISLKNSDDRRKNIIKQCDKHNIKIEFFDAIDAKKFRFKKIKSLKDLQDSNKIISEGAIGCFLSHYMLWNVLKYFNHNEFIIIEDDIIFKSNFIEKLKFYKQQLPNNWDHVFLGYSCFDNANDPIKINENVLKCKLSPLGTFAYMIKKSSINTLLESTDNIWSHLDIQIQQKSLQKLNSYLFFPSLIEHNYSFQSLIKNEIT